MLKNNLVAQYIKPLFPQPTPLSPGGALKQQVQCVLFDVYGTLFISASGDISIAKRQSEKIRQLEKLLVKFGIADTPQAVLKDFFDAIEHQHKLRKAKGVDVPEVEIDGIWLRVLKINDLELARAFAVEFELLVNPVYPMPHLEKLLGGCQKLDILLGLISNAQFFTLYLFHWFLNSDPRDLGFHPDLMFLSYQFGIAKPSLFMFQLAAETLQKMNIPARTVLYVGNDMLNDIYPARQIGFQTALFAGDARSLRLRKNHAQCRDLSPDIVITDLKQILDLLHNQGASHETTPQPSGSA